MAFDWTPYLSVLVNVFGEFGLKLEAIAKDRMDSVIREAVLKDNSIASQLDLSFADRGPRKTIKIKLEIDTNPPAGSGEASTYLDFPTDHDVRHQDLPSYFALKVHALLCRPYVKGRDWFDFSWYVARDVVPNIAHLRAALVQTGPWAGQENLTIDHPWLRDALGTKITAIDWKKAADDVARFLRPAELKSVGLWSDRFFLAKLGKL